MLASRIEREHPSERLEESGNLVLHALGNDEQPARSAARSRVDVAVVETSGWNATVASEFAVEEVTLGALSPPVADFAASPITGSAPLTVTFTNQSTGDISSQEWTFGDGTTNTEESPAHTYTAPGVYSPTLTVSGPGGTDSLTHTRYITAYHWADVVPNCSIDDRDIQAVAGAWRCPGALTKAVEQESYRLYTWNDIAAVLTPKTGQLR